MQTTKTDRWRSLKEIDAVGLDEASEQLAALAHVRYVQLERGVARMTGVIAQLGGVIAGRVGGDRNKIAWVDTAPGRLLVFVPIRGLARLGTATVALEDAVLVSRATQLVAFTDRSFLPVSISVAAAALYELADDLKVDIQRPDQDVSLLRISRARVWELDRLVQDMCAAAAAAAGSFQSAGGGIGPDDEVLRWCTELLTVERTQAHSLEGAASRRRAALRAREFVDAHLETRLSLATVCRASFTSARALQYGFREMFGLSPMAYVRVARLARVRRDLYLAQRCSRTVTQLAMKWGFGHLGQFSKDYCAMFGELPSSTLERRTERPGMRVRAARIGSPESIGLVNRRSLPLLVEHA